MVINRLPVLFFLVWLGAMGCAAQTDSQNTTAPCESDCVQPPIKQSQLTTHLTRDQERILAREDYKQRPGPSAMDIIFGPLPKEPLRPGPEPVCDEGIAYDGPLSWHYIPFESVATDQARQPEMRGRDVSGAHCFFAHKPNRRTPIFAILARHQPGGDNLYVGGPNHRLTAIDTGPLRRRTGRALKVRTDHMHCAFRHDQNQMGAVIIPFDSAAGDDPHYAVFAITTYGAKQVTGQTVVAPRRSGLPNGHTIDVELPVTKYPRPRIEFVDQVPSLRHALEAADEAITAGDFRLRPEFIYPQMPYQSYLDTGAEEFCPHNTTCQTPPAHLDADQFPRLPAYHPDELEPGDQAPAPEADKGS